VLLRPLVLCVAVLGATGCGSQQATHGVLGVQTTIVANPVRDEVDRIDWSLERAQAKLAASSGEEQLRIAAVAQSTLKQEADVLDRLRVPLRAAPAVADLVMALRALGADGTLAGSDLVRAALANLRPLV
jgi:hypothetical protein